MNIVSLSGRLTRDPELRTTNSGKQVANFSLALNKGKDRTEFVNCIAWDKTAELIAEYCRKGQTLPCSGELQTRSWEKDGEKRYATEVVVNKFDFPQRNSSDAQPAQQPANNYEMDDEIPF